MDRNDSGVRDKYERLGEMLLASVGTGVAVAGFFLKMMDDQAALTLLVISFSLYQSTSIAGMVKEVFTPDGDGGVVNAEKR